MAESNDPQYWISKAIELAPERKQAMGSSPIIDPLKQQQAQTCALIAIAMLLSGLGAVLVEVANDVGTINETTRHRL